ncbi:MAG TPA: AAA family ATPase [Pedomonas sp.]|uniref:AAA family ATPase n=1 Tax=Pedomonas sp. TaxID=2976421 RepID=UPI002F3FC64A
MEPVETLETILAFRNDTELSFQALEDVVSQRNQRRSLTLRFPMGKAAEMIGRSSESIREAEASGRLPQPELSATNRRVGYTLPEVNNMRRVFGTLPWRSETDEPVILSVQNFKGGVGKSTIAVHTAHYLALKGYRVLLVDCDPQGSSTSLMGINPDVDLGSSETLYPYLRRDYEDLSYAIRPTHWEGLDLIPANLDLFSSEYEMAVLLKDNPIHFDWLRDGIERAAQNYDVVILDSPPALGFISLSVLRAANALLIPTLPSNVDLFSTRKFISMMTDVLEQLSSLPRERTYKFLRVVISRGSDTKTSHGEMSHFMEETWGRRMMRAQLKDSAEIDNAGMLLKSVYEIGQPTASRQTWTRCMSYLDAYGKELELLIRKTWPSHYESLEQAGLL